MNLTLAREENNQLKTDRKPKQSG